MIRGLYTSALGMMTQMNKMDVVTNNLANVDTAAYKKDGTIIQSFSDELAKRLDDPKFNVIQYNPGIGKLRPGVFVEEIYTDFTKGAYKPTENKTDLALSGDGFFAIQAKDKDGKDVEKYTRDGSFKIDFDGTLKTSEGNTVLGKNGPIVVTNGDITVGASGGVYSKGELVDSLKIVDFENKNTLRKDANNLYNKIDSTVEKPYSGDVLQGYIEGSNVNTVREMVDMIALSRNYESNQKVLQAQDESLSKALTEIARK